MQNALRKQIWPLARSRQWTAGTMESPDLLLLAVCGAMPSLRDIFPCQGEQQFSIPESGLGTLAPASPAQKQL